MTMHEGNQGSNENTNDKKRNKCLSQSYGSRFYSFVFILWLSSIIVIPKAYHVDKILSNTPDISTEEIINPTIIIDKSQLVTINKIDILLEEKLSNVTKERNEENTKEVFIKEETTVMEDNEPRAPIVIDAGRGTTGTHIMAEATCHLGQYSIHYHLACLSRSNDTVNYGDEFKLPKEYEFSITLHKQLLDKVKCILNRCKSQPAKRYRDELLDLTDRLFAHQSNHSNEVLALHDTPYPNLVPTVIDSVRKHYQGRLPFILLTERDPLEYVERRMSTYHAKTDMMCKKPSLINSTTLKGGAFDVVGCINNGLTGLSDEESDKVLIHELFTTMHNIGNFDMNIKVDHNMTSAGRQDVVRQVKEYQDAVRINAVYSTNLFMKDDRTNKEDLSSQILSTAKDIYQNVEGPNDVYVNLRKMIRISKFF